MKRREILMTKEHEGKFRVRTPYDPRFSEVLRLVLPDDARDKNAGLGYDSTARCWVFPAEHQYVVEEILDQIFFGADFHLVDSFPDPLDVEVAI